MDEETPSVLMDGTGKIIRTSIYTFLKYFQFFTTIPVLLLLPFSASTLLSQALFENQSFFHVAGFSFSSQVKSQSFFPFVFGFPFAVSSFIISKSSIIQALNDQKSLPPTFFSVISLCKTLLLTFLCSLIFIITITNAAAFCLLSVSSLFRPIVLAAFYSIIANAIVVSNIALVVAGMDLCKWNRAIYKAWLLRKAEGPTLLLLFLPTNLGLAAIEALFRYRVTRVYKFVGALSSSMALEGLFIAYLYSLLVVLDTIVYCLFYKRVGSIFMADQRDRTCRDSLEEIP